MGRADRVVVCVNQTDRLGETEEIAVARMAKEVDQRAKIHAPGLKAPIFWTAAKRAIVAPIGLRSAVEEGVPVSPYSYQSRLASARIDVVRDYLLGRLLSPADHRSAKLLTDLAVGRYALERLEREIDVTYKSIQSYHHEVTAVVDAVRKEEQRQLDAAMKKTGSEIARVLLQSEEKATSYVAERPLWRFLWRMEPISLEATRRLMGSSLVHLNNVEGSASGFTWEGAQTLREVEILFSHAVGRTDGVMSTYATNLRNILARVAHSKVLYRHSLSRELEVEIARIVEQLDRELEFAKGMNPIRTLSSPMAGYEEKVRLEGERLQSAGDSTVLTTVGFQAAVGLGTLFAIHLGVPPPVAYGTGGALAVSAFLWMKGRWRSLKWQYGERINAHGVQLRTDLVESMKSELKRSYSTYFKNLLDAYKAAHGKVAAKIDDRGYAVREELRVLKNIMGELKS
ncbi:hypothetical protein DFJ74DRAFT_659136 [Hyaloraphidium curvatum]|nr:hypothetical protein DFJ74DRAFT_659136 [Hyaloraphidium curvatum]